MDRPGQGTRKTRRLRIPRRVRCQAGQQAIAKPGYTAKPALLTQGELAFYWTLRRALPKWIGLSFKTRLADILHCPKDLWGTAHGRQIAQKHVDFVLLEPDRTVILAVVELDDRSHMRPERQRRDDFLNDALASARIPLIRIKAARRYSVEELRAVIQAALPPDMRAHSLTPVPGDPPASRLRS